MTTGPKLRLGKTLVPGVLAVVLFAMMGLITLNTGFGAMSGFPGDVSITSAIGYAMFDYTSLQAEQGVPGTEPFLISFLLIAVVLDAALDASLVLAKREEEGEPVTALSSTPDSDVTPSGTGSSSSADDATGGTPAATDGGEPR